MKKIHAFLDKFTHGISYISMVATMIAMFVLVIDIIMNLTTGGVKRVIGSYEMVEMCMVVMMFLSMGTTQMDNGHVRVDMFVKKFPPRVGNVVFGIVEGISAVLCLMMAVKGFGQISTNMASNAGTAVIHIPYAPFNAIMSIGMFIFTITLAVSTIEYFMKAAHPVAEND